MSQPFPPQEEPIVEEPFAEIHLSQYWAILVKSRRLILLCLGAAFVAAAAVSVLSRPAYLGTVVVAVEKDQGSPLDPNWKPEVYGGYDPEFQ